VVPNALGFTPSVLPPLRSRPMNALAALPAAAEALPPPRRHALGRRALLSSSAAALLTTIAAVVSFASEPALAAAPSPSAKGCFADCSSECNKLAKVR
jgi:hypothetical protein